MHQETIYLSYIYICTLYIYILYIYIRFFVESNAMSNYEKRSRWKNNFIYIRKYCECSRLYAQKWHCSQVLYVYISIFNTVHIFSFARSCIHIHACMWYIYIFIYSLFCSNVKASSALIDNNGNISVCNFSQSVVMCSSGLRKNAVHTYVGNSFSIPWLAPEILDQVSTCVFTNNYVTSM